MYDSFSSWYLLHEKPILADLDRFCVQIAQNLHAKFCIFVKSMRAIILKKKRPRNEVAMSRNQTKITFFGACFSDRLIKNIK